MQKNSLFRSLKGAFGQANIKLFVAIQVFIAVAFLSVAAYMLGAFHRMAREDADAIGERAVYEVGGRIDNFLLEGLESLVTTSDAVDFLIENGADDALIERYFASVTAAEGGGDEVGGVYGWIRGRYIDGAGWVPPEGYNPKDRDWFIDAVRAQRHPALISPYIDARTGRTILSISRLLSDRASVVSVDIALDDLQSFMGLLSFGGDGFGFLIDRSSLVLAHTDRSLLGRDALHDNTLPEGFRRLVGAVLASPDGTRFGAEIDGEECTAFASRVMDDWIVVAVLPQTALLRRMQVSFSKIVVLFLILVLFSLIQISLTFRRRLILERRVDDQTETIREQSRLMMDMQTNIIEELATLIEARDANTGEHVKNTKVYSVMVAKMLYMRRLHRDEVNKKFIADLGAAAPLHDIGKITIPDSVLLKRGKLSDFEYETMKNHTRFGGAIIRRIFKNVVDRDAVQMAVDVAQYHHERWDGRGYPVNLAGEEIPLAARILAVADCFDALVSERCYKPAVPRDDAFRMIREEAGTHFDPEIVEIFISLRPKIEEHLDRLKAGQNGGL